MADGAGLLAGLAKEQLGLVIGIGIGSALAASLEPEIVGIKQAQYQSNPDVAIDAGTAAAIVAEAVELLGWGKAEAAQFGIDSDRFDALVNEALNAPGLGELLQMLRRGTLQPDDFTHGLRKAKIEGRWDGPLEDLRDRRLEPSTIATAVQRGVLANHGLLPVGPPSEVGLVPPMPSVALDTLAEAAASGFNADRLAVYARIAGLPPAPGELLQMLNRGIIEEVDFARGVAEGNTRNEWAPFLEQLRRRLLTPHEYAELRLRGWIDDGAMYAGSALSGLEQDDTDLLAKLLGRPLSFRQVFIGERRGGTYEGPTGAIDPAFLRALQQSNIRPEWYSIAWAQRYTYPSAFVLRALASDGDLTAAQTEQILLYQGWEPTLAKQVAGKWSGAQTGAGKQETKTELDDEFAGGYITEAEYRAALAALGYTGHAQDLLVHLGDARRVKRYRDKAVDAIEAAYTSFKLDDTQATSELAELNVTGQAVVMLLNVWRKIRLDTIRLLTPPQVKKAYSSNLLTRDQALQALEWLHYAAADAVLFLDE